MAGGRCRRSPGLARSVVLVVAWACLLAFARPVQAEDLNEAARAILSDPAYQTELPGAPTASPADNDSSFLDGVGQDTRDPETVTRPPSLPAGGSTALVVGRTLLWVLATALVIAIVLAVFRGYREARGGPPHETRG